MRARRDAVPGSLRRLSHAVAARRSRLHLNRAGVLGGLAVVVLAGLGVLVYGTPVLAVRTVAVTGAHLVTAEQVREVAAVALGTPLARVDTADVEARVRALPPVAEVTVARSWPSTLVIEVRERTPVAAVRVAGGYLMIDADGVAFHTVAARPKDLVLVRVAEPALGSADDSTRAAAAVARALTARLRAEVREIVVSAAAEIRLELAGGLVVIWGDASRSDVKALAATALLDEANRRIDVSAPEVAAVS